MAKKDIGNTVSQVNEVETEFEALDREFAELAEDFGVDRVMPESSSGMGPAEFGFIKNIFKRRAKGALKKLLKVVRGSAKYASCIPAVLKVVAAVKSGRWGTAIKEAVRAWRCIRSK